MVPNDNWFKYMFACFTILFGSWGLALAIDWTWHRAAVRIRETAAAQVAGALNVSIAKRDYLNSFGALSDAKAAALVKLQPTIEVVPGHEAGPIWLLRLPGGDDGWEFVEWTFLDQFMSKCTETALAPVRGWSGSPERFRDAQRLTNYFVSNGYARPDVGNQPATWIDRRAALISIGYIKPNEEE